MSLRKAINEKCKDCAYDPKNRGTWRQQITIFPVYDCPLWSVRPLSDDAWSILPNPRDKQSSRAYQDWSIDRLLDRANSTDNEGEK